MRIDPITILVVGAIVLTLGADQQGKLGAELVSYGGVRNVLAALGSRSVRIALMTAIGVTERLGNYNRSTEAHDWKRRSERLYPRGAFDGVRDLPNMPIEHEPQHIRDDLAKVAAKRLANAV